MSEREDSPWQELQQALARYLDAKKAYRAGGLSLEALRQQEEAYRAVVQIYKWREG